MAHRAVIFAIAQLSCILLYCNEPLLNKLTILSVGLHNGSAIILAARVKYIGDKPQQERRLRMINR